MSAQRTRVKRAIRNVGAFELLENRTVLSTASWLVIANDPVSLPDHLAEQVSAAGGALTATMPKIGVALAASDDPDFAATAAQIPGIRFVVPDVEFPAESTTSLAVEPTVGSNVLDTTNDYSDLQWGLDAINSPEAWAAGARGAGVRVAVLDSGIDIHHPDLASKLNLDLSKSFVISHLDDDGQPVYEPVAYDPTLYDPKNLNHIPFSHATAVAGIIAADADDGLGITGVAPEVEIVPVKVSRDTGGGSGGWSVQGIYYAANIGADVINLSLGQHLMRSGWHLADPYNPDDDVFFGAASVTGLWYAYNRAITYAYQQGSTVIASAGNAAFDRNAGNAALDGNASADMIVLPADAPHAIQVSATGPVGWALDPTTDLDVPAPYTNYGMSAIDLAAPGGTSPVPHPTGAVYLGNPATAPTEAFDLVMTTLTKANRAPFSSERWGWLSGTSFSAPHVAGVAALIIGMNGGDMHPAQVRSILFRSADDLGKAGKDDYYGHGRVNAENAVSLMGASLASTSQFFPLLTLDDPRLADLYALDRNQAEQAWEDLTSHRDAIVDWLAERIILRTMATDGAADLGGDLDDGGTFTIDDLDLIFANLADEFPDGFGY